MITGIDINEVVEYTLQDDTEPKTIFRLGVIPTVVLAFVKDQSRVVVMNITENDGQTKVRPNLGEMQVAYVRYGLKGWSNFKDKDGNDIPFETEEVQHGGREIKVVSDGSINKLPDDALMELSGVLQQMNSLNANEVKNLNSPSA